MQDQNKIKAIIEKHIEAMMSEIGSGDDVTPTFYFGDNAAQIITEQVFGVIRYGADVEEYFKSQDMIKE